MRLLPYRRFTIETPLAPAEVQARLRDATEREQTFRFSRPTRPLVGTIDGTSFNVMRNVTGRNSFRPCMRGSIEAAGSGARLRGTMQLHELVIAFVGFFTFAAGTMFLSGAARSAANSELDPAMLAGLGVLIFLTAMTLGGFAVEVHRSFDELTGLVDVSHADLR